MMVKPASILSAAFAAMLVGLAFGETQPVITTFTDKRDGKTYKKVTIGKQVWMAENLNYDAKGSVCYDNKPENCARFGRLYDWKTAKEACPAGWHLPSDTEWGVLMVAVGGVKDEYDYWQGAGTKLKSSEGWANNGNGTDNYGFSALPGGNGPTRFYGAGSRGTWWSATEYTASSPVAWTQDIYFDKDYAYRNDVGKTVMFSVRCVQDDKEGQK